MSIWALSSLFLSAGTLVAPAGFDKAPGPVNNAIPFRFKTSRYQQIYNATDLFGLVGKQITAIAFRLDEQYGEDLVWSYVYPKLDISMSVTPHEVDSITSDFEANHGLNRTMVRAGEYVVRALEGTSLPLNPFDLRFGFESPFFYSGGNLLVDFSMSLVYTDIAVMDADIASGSVNRVYREDRSLPKGLDGIGLITQFTFIPEPPSILLAAAIIGLAGVARIKFMIINRR